MISASAVERGFSEAAGAEVVFSESDMVRVSVSVSVSGIGQNGNNSACDANAIISVLPD